MKNNNNSQLIASCEKNTTESQIKQNKGLTRDNQINSYPEYIENQSEDLLESSIIKELEPITEEASIDEDMYNKSNIYSNNIQFTFNKYHRQYHPVEENSVESPDPPMDLVDGNSHTKFERIDVNKLAKQDNKKIFSRISSQQISNTQSISGIMTTEGEPSQSNPFSSPQVSLQNTPRKPNTHVQPHHQLNKLKNQPPTPKGISKQNQTNSAPIGHLSIEVKNPEKSGSKKSGQSSGGGLTVIKKYMSSYDKIQNPNLKKNSMKGLRNYKNFSTKKFLTIQTDEVVPENLSPSGDSNQQILGDKQNFSDQLEMIKDQLTEKSGLVTPSVQFDHITDENISSITSSASKRNISDRVDCMDRLRNIVGFRDRLKMKGYSELESPMGDDIHIWGLRRDVQYVDTNTVSLSRLNTSKSEKFHDIQSAMEQNYTDVENLENVTNPLTGLTKDTGGKLFFGQGLIEMGSVNQLTEIERKQDKDPETSPLMVEKRLADTLKEINGGSGISGLKENASSEKMNSHRMSESTSERVMRPVFNGLQINSARNSPKNIDVTDPNYQNAMLESKMSKFSKTSKNMSGPTVLPFSHEIQNKMMEDTDQYDPLKNLKLHHQRLDSIVTNQSEYMVKKEGGLIYSNTDKKYNHSKSGEFVVESGKDLLDKTKEKLKITDQLLSKSHNFPSTNFNLALGNDSSYNNSSNFIFNRKGSNNQLDFRASKSPKDANDKNWKFMSQITCIPHKTDPFTPKGILTRNTSNMAIFLNLERNSATNKQQIFENKKDNSIIIKDNSFSMINNTSMTKHKNSQSFHCRKDSVDGNNFDVKSFSNRFIHNQGISFQSNLRNYSTANYNISQHGTKVKDMVGFPDPHSHTMNQLISGYSRSQGGSMHSLSLMRLKDEIEGEKYRSYNILHGSEDDGSNEEFAWDANRDVLDEITKSNVLDCDIVDVDYENLEGGGEFRKKSGASDVENNMNIIIIDNETKSDLGVSDNAIEESTNRKNSKTKRIVMDFADEVNETSGQRSKAPKLATTTANANNLINNQHQPQWEEESSQPGKIKHIMGDNNKSQKINQHDNYYVRVNQKQSVNQKKQFNSLPSTFSPENNLMGNIKEVDIWNECQEESTDGNMNNRVSKETFFTVCNPDWATNQIQKNNIIFHQKTNSFNYPEEDFPNMATKPILNFNSVIGVDSNQQNGNTPNNLSQAPEENLHQKKPKSGQIIANTGGREGYDIYSHQSNNDGTDTDMNTDNKTDDRQKSSNVTDDKFKSDIDIFEKFTDEKTGKNQKSLNFISKSEIYANDKVISNFHSNEDLTKHLFATNPTNNEQAGVGGSEQKFQKRTITTSKNELSFDVDNNNQNDKKQSVSTTKAAPEDFKPGWSRTTTMKINPVYHNLENNIQEVTTNTQHPILHNKNNPNHEDNRWMMKGGSMAPPSPVNNKSIHSMVNMVKKYNFDYEIIRSPSNIGSPQTKQIMTECKQFKTTNSSFDDQKAPLNPENIYDIKSFQTAKFSKKELVSNGLTEAFRKKQSSFAAASELRNNKLFLQEGNDQHIVHKEHLIKVKRRGMSSDGTWRPKLNMKIEIDGSNSRQSQRPKQIMEKIPNTKHQLNSIENMDIYERSKLWKELNQTEKVKYKSIMDMSRFGSGKELGGPLTRNSSGQKVFSNVAGSLNMSNSNMKSYHMYKSICMNNKGDDGSFGGSKMGEVVYFDSSNRKKGDKSHTRSIGC